MKCLKESFVTLAMRKVSDGIGRPTDNVQVIPFDNNGQLKEAFNIRLEEPEVLDIKFLYGCSKPTIVVLYQVVLEDKDFVEGPWSRNNLDNGPDLLIPVPPPPLCGVLIVGEETIVYCSANAFQTTQIDPSITKAYGRVDPDGSRYLLGDHMGLLSLLVIIHTNEKVTELKIMPLGETSLASTISYLHRGFEYIVSSFGVICYFIRPPVSLQNLNRYTLIHHQEIAYYLTITEGKKEHICFSKHLQYYCN
ncbi:DNA damage-binding protein 1a isoform X7 [Vigna radiata var. radiata]|uniref:DNA damage-binding protein 1a isoform X7 n=1 Tax=Vigna radiata var. radiata TaxID=3916 RepID=A0A3Q0F5C3_VIGRR|nr:DNA damage-binding protein 1a isoform X7 [Vigna radiata var. radiata]